MKQTSSRSGFTLMEMSIVVVVVGLVIGALSYSSILLRSSRVQSIMKDINQYKTSVQAFVMGYDFLPGDLPEASHYWPNALDGWSKYVASSGGTDSVQDMNGNGDGLINNYEVIYAWLMMDVSGVAPGISTKMKGFSIGWMDELESVFGIPSAHACFAVAPGSNIPPTQLDGGGYFLGHAHDPLYGRIDNAITVGSLVPEDTSLSRMRGALLTPAEALLLDTKMDNSVANTGEVVSANGTGTTGCVDGDDAYLSGDEVPSCFMVFWLTKR